MRKLGIQLIYVALCAALLPPVCFAQTADETGGRTIWDGVYTQAQADKGRNTYLAHCSQCHGDNLGGFRGALNGKQFMEGWSEDTVHSLFHRIQSTMPPGRPGSIPDQDYVDIVAFFFSRNEFPTGDDELGVEGLDRIRIEEKHGPAPVPSFAMVQVVGCLVNGSEEIFRVEQASAAARIRDPAESEGDELAAAQAKPLGDKNFALLRNVIYLEPQGLVGHKVEVKGFLIRDDAGDRINVSTIQSLRETCP